MSSLTLGQFGGVVSVWEGIAMILSSPTLGQFGGVVSVWQGIALFWHSPTLDSPGKASCGDFFFHI